MKLAIRRKKKLERSIAKKRMEYLLERAEKVKNEDIEIARRYVEIAKAMSTRYRVRIPRRFKAHFCKKCLYPYTSQTLRVRVRKNRVIITCLRCGFTRRIPLS